MNNILTFEDFKRMNIRQVESVIYHQFIEDVIKDDIGLNEGFVRNYINKSASKFIQNALADEIEKGKELERNIKEALDGLNKGFNEIENEIKNKSKNPKLEAIEKVKEAIKAVQSQTFDTLTMIGSEGEIDFAGFMGSSTIAAAANFGILFSPIRSLFITRKAYKYFLGIIKQTIRRNLLIIQLNFDQFENLILQKSFETDNDSETSTMRETLSSIILSLQRELCGKDSKLNLSSKKSDEMRKYLANFQKTQNALFKQNKEDTKNNPLRSLWEDQHNNTYTRTLEQIKQYINDDSQKELDALKNSITKMAGNDAELGSYGELLISAAEEYAIHTNHGINNNFIKMSSVFNLENQKKLIDLIVETQKENEKEIKNNIDKINKDNLEEDRKKKIKEGKKLYKRELKDKEGDFDTFDKFEAKFNDDDVKCLKAFFDSNKGKDIYEELIKKKPLYKYLIMNNTTLNTLLSSISDLDVVEISNASKFFENIIGEKNALYYLMAERSIKDAVNSNDSDDSDDSDDYFGLLNTKDENVKLDGNFLKSDNVKDILSQDFFPSKKFRNADIEKRYFLTFGTTDTEDKDNIFEVLHDFETKIFDTDKYNDNISTKSKQKIINIINNHLNIDKSITKKLAAYLVILEAHMSLVKQKPFFVIQNNKVLFDNKCFGDVTDLKFSNKKAFVEIKKEHYDDIKKFLDVLNDLKKRDFDIENENNEEENK